MDGTFVRSLIMTLLIFFAVSASADGLIYTSIENDMGDYVLFVYVEDPESTAAKDLFKSVGYKSDPVQNRGVILIGNAGTPHAYLMQEGKASLGADSRGETIVTRAELSIRNSFNLSTESTYIPLVFSPSNLSRLTQMNELELPLAQARFYSGIFKCGESQSLVSKFRSTGHSQASIRLARVLEGQIKVHTLEGLRISKHVLIDGPKSRVFHISESGLIEPDFKLGRTTRVHMRDTKANAPEDLTAHTVFNRLHSDFENTYFFTKIDTEEYLVVPPVEEDADYPSLIRSLQFFEIHFGDKIPADEGIVPNVDPKKPFIINKTTGAIRNLGRMNINPPGLVSGFPGTGKFAHTTGAGSAKKLFDFAEGRLGHTPLVPTTVPTPVASNQPALPPGLTRMNDIYPGVATYRYEANGEVQILLDRPAPNLILCTEKLTGEKKVRYSSARR